MKKLPIILFAMLLSGCFPGSEDIRDLHLPLSTQHIIPSYIVDGHSLSLLKNGYNAISVIQERPGFIDRGEMSCFTNTLRTPVGQTFSSYIIDALKGELKSTNLLDENAANKLYVTVMRVDFSDRLGATRWVIETKFSIKGDTFLISSVFPVQSSYIYIKTCRNRSLYFVKAVAEHLWQLYTKPEFRAAIGSYSE